MKLYAIRNYDNNTPTGYYIGKHGPVTFTRKEEARKYAQELNTLPHATNRVYRAEEIRN